MGADSQRGFFPFIVLTTMLRIFFGKEYMLCFAVGYISGYIVRQVVERWRQKGNE